MAFADKLKRLREQAGWSQAELARRSGVSANRIQLYELAISGARMSNAIKLAKALGVGVEAFTVEDKPAPKPKPKTKAKK